MTYEQQTILGKVFDITPDSAFDTPGSCCKSCALNKDSARCIAQGESESTACFTGTGHIYAEPEL